MHSNIKNQNEKNKTAEYTYGRMESQPIQKFTSNMCAVLNDPRKDRNKINYLFTKTWGSDFTDNVSNVPSIKNTVFKSEFKDYSKSLGNRYSKHVNNKVNANCKNDNLNYGGFQIGDIDQIPKIFFDPNFSLGNKDTFDKIIKFKLLDTINKDKNKMNNLFHESNNKNPFLEEVKTVTKPNYEASSCNEILDKLSFYLDITETHISKQISTKANTFFHAMTSQDEVQEHVLKTCSAVKYLRKNLINLDEGVVLRSIKAIKLTHLKLKYQNLIDQLELVSFIYKTQPTIQLHLSSAEFTGALDLISMSQEILRQDLRGIRSLRHYDPQFSEIEKVINKMLHQEFSKYIVSDLSRPFAIDSYQIYNEEKLSSLMLGILRIKNTPFIDLCKDEIFIYIKSTIKMTIVEYVSKIDDDISENFDDDNNVKLKKLKIQEFLHLLSRVLTNIRNILLRSRSIVNCIQSVVDSNAVHESGKELITKANHTKLTASLKDLIINSCDYAQERLVNLLENKFKENSIDRLSLNDFISLTNLTDQFIIEFDTIANKKTSSLRSWIQNQANKFLQKFHLERKEKLSLALESERWKQSDVPNDFRNLIDHIVANGIGKQCGKKFDSKVRNPSDFIVINNENYVIFTTVIVLIKLMTEYSQFAVDMPNFSFDVMTRLVELFKIFNSKTYQMILGVGAVQTGVLRVITFKTLAITYRCLELVLYFLPLLKEFYKEKLGEKQSNSDKQFNQLIKDYTDHKSELNNKLVFMIDENFREFLTQYEVIAPVPSQCFRSICQQITRVHEIVTELLGSASVVQLFTEIHTKFKNRLSMRLHDLGVTNDGGPQHALIFSDMSYYIKQFKGLEGLNLISLNFEDVWAI